MTVEFAKKRKNSNGAFQYNRNKIHETSDSFLLAPPPDPPKNLLSTRKNVERTDSLASLSIVSPVNELTIVPPDPIMPR